MIYKNIYIYIYKSYCAFIGPAGLGPGPGPQGPYATSFFSEATFLNKSLFFPKKSLLFFKKKSIFIKKSSGISQNRSGTVSRVLGRSTCIDHT